MDVLKPPSSPRGIAPNVRQSAHILGNRSELYWNLLPVCVCVGVCECVCVYSSSNWANDSQQEGGRRTKQQHRQVGKECVRVGVFVWLSGCKK